MAGKKSGGARRGAHGGRSRPDTGRLTIKGGVSVDKAQRAGRQRTGEQRVVNPRRGSAKPSGSARSGSAPGSPPIRGRAIQPSVNAGSAHSTRNAGGCGKHSY